MKSEKAPDPNAVHPVAGYENEEINALIPILTCSDLEKAKRELGARLWSS